MKNISEILQNSTLTKIVQRANQLNEVNRQIQQVLPPQFRQLYRIVNLIGNQLVIEVPNGTVLQGLQLQQSQLLAQIQPLYPQINECLFKINPNFKPY